MTPVAEPPIQRPADLEYRYLSGTFQRLRAEGDSPDAPVRYEFTASSDAPVQMWPGCMEILSHDPSAVRMGWIQSGNAPALWMHDRYEHRGIIESAEITGGKIKVVVRMSPNATDLIKDIDAGIIKNISIGYRIYDEVISSRQQDANGNVVSTTWTVTDWEPKEVSFVTIPADTTVGFGRAEGAEKCRVRFLEQRAQQLAPTRTPDMNPPAAPPATTITVNESEQARTDAVTAERKRMAGITAAANAARESGFGDFTARAQEALEKGESVEDFQRHVLDNMKRTPVVTTEDLGLTDKEQNRYSLINVIDGLAQGDLAKRAGFEMEVSRAAQKAFGHGSSERVCIPTDVLLRGWIPQSPALAARMGITDRERTLVSVGSGGAAANLVPRELMADMWIESLREGTVLVDGATMLAGLVGDVDIPLELLSPAFYWVGENTEPTDGVWTTGLVSFRLKTIAARISMTRKALKQSTPNVDSVLAANLRRGCSIGIEKAAFSGASSSTRPAGILNVSGIGDVATSGTLAFHHVTDLRADVAGANAPVDTCEFFTSSIGISRLRSTPIEEGHAERIGTWQNGTLIVEGKPCRETNCIPINLGGGTDRTAILFGDKRSVCVGMWGGLELGIDTATMAATGGKVLRAFQDLDIQVPQAARWSAIQDLA